MANKLRGQSISAVRASDISRYKDRSGLVGGLEGASKFHQEALVSETVETHVVPRQSITRKQLLNMNPLPAQTVTLKGQQILKIADSKGNLIPQFDANGKPIMVPFTDNRGVKGSRPVRTLLIQGNPFKQDQKIGRRSHYDKSFRPDEQFQTTENLKQDDSIVLIPIDKIGIK